MAKFVLGILICVCLCLCLRLNAQSEYSFELLSAEHSNWKATLTLPQSLAERNEQLIQIRGFIYSLPEGVWVLASTPHLKSCCIGTDNLTTPQIQVTWLNIPEQTNSAVLIQGIFHIDPANRYRYLLTKATLIPQEKALWPYFLPLIAIGILGVILLIKPKLG